MEWYAHSAENFPEDQWQTLKSHLKNVGLLASHKAKHFNGQDLAQVAGLLHDLGKYTQEFQRRLRGSTVKVDHSTHGASEVLNLESIHPFFRWLIAYAIAGHHAGLADRKFSTEKQKTSALDERLNNRANGLPQLIQIGW